MSIIKAEQEFKMLETRIASWENRVVMANCVMAVTIGAVQFLVTLVFLFIGLNAMLSMAFSAQN